MKTQVIDNWLDPHLVEFLDKNFTFDRPHSFGNLSLNPDVNPSVSQESFYKGFYKHVLNPHEAINKYLFYKLARTLKLNLGLIRMYLNVHWKGMNGTFHIDDGDLTCLYMATKTLMGDEGCFEIKGEKKYEFVQNRLIVFEAGKEHRGMAPYDGVRITLSFKTKLMKEKSSLITL